MKIFYPHLQEYFKDKITIDDFSECLIQLGHENEISNNFIDIEFTPNRGDALSLSGLSRDLGVFFDRKKLTKTFDSPINNFNFNFKNNAKHECPYISFLYLEIDNIKPFYKDYLESYFIDLNINKKNLFTDISNFLLYREGQPTHCYDYNSVSSGITLEKSNKKEIFKTVINQDIEIEGGDLVFKSDGEIVNLSGIMGGVSSSCSKETKKVLIECAYFVPEAILGKATKYNLNSDASYRFERGVDPNCHEKILRQFIQIIDDHAEIKDIGMNSYNIREFKNLEINKNINKIEGILGMSIGEDLFDSTLNKLGFSVNKTIKVPSYRNDIVSNNDIAEELARVIGYDNIPQKKFILSHQEKEKEISKEEVLESFLVRNGFSEVINQPFSFSTSESCIQVSNPLDSNKKSLRTSLLESLLINLDYNLRRQKESIKLFEFSNIYEKTSSEIVEKRMLGIIVAGREGKNFKEFNKKIDKPYFKNILNEIFHDDVSDKILEIDRDRIEAKFKDKIFFFEYELNNLRVNTNEKILDKMKLGDPVRTYKKISEFPLMNRDISFLLKEESKIVELEEFIENLDFEELKEVFSFDFYKDNKSSNIKVAFRFVFQSEKKTLEDHEIDKKIKYIVKSTLEIGGIEVPGY